MTTRIAIILGAPKCGTSSLFRWLCRHPAIRGTHPKETYLFLDSNHPLSRRPKGLSYHDRGIADVIEANSRPKVGANLLLESTTHNLYQSQFRTECGEFVPAVKALVLLRQPSDRILSSFLYTQHNLGRISVKLTFADYVDLLLNGDTARLTRFVRHPASCYVLSHELFHSTYAGHLLAWNESLGSANVGAWISEELFADPASVVADIVAWLSAEARPNLSDEFRPHNQTQRVGIQWLHKLAHRTGHIIPEWSGRHAIKQKYFRIQRILSKARYEDYSKPLEVLDRYFEPHNVALFQLLGREVTAWERIRSTGSVL